MLIKKSKSRFNYYYIKKYRSKFSLFLLITFYSILVCSIGGYLVVNKNSKQFIKDAYLVLLDPPQTIINFFNGITSKPANRISVDIKFKDYQKLEYDRKVALSIDKLISNEYVPATINYNNRTYKVKLRLKGDHTDHLIGDKWSFRIKVKNDDTIFGMKQFSLHHPRTRNYIYEWLFHKILKREQVISLRYDFINVTVNGDNLGIYAIEEHFEKRLIENNRRKNGPIIRFNENLMWDEVLQFETKYSDVQQPGYGNYLSSNIDAFQTNVLLRDTTLYNNYLKAISLLESFRQGELNTSDVFDLDLLSTFFAITDLFGAEHGSRWHNTRFYFNPITSRLEPIGFDANDGFTGIKEINNLIGIAANNFNKDNDWNDCGSDGDCTIIDNNNSQNNGRFDLGEGFSYLLFYYKRIFEDQEFYKQYVKKLEKFSNQNYLDSFFTEVQPELKMKLNIIYKEWPQFKFDKNILYKNQSYIRDILNPKKGLHAYMINRKKNQFEIAFGNIQSLPIKIESILIGDSLNIYPKEKIILQSKLLKDQVEYFHYSFAMPNNIQLDDNSFKIIKTGYSIDGTSKIKNIDTFPWHYNDINFTNNTFIKKKTNINEFDFIKIDYKNKIIEFIQGTWKIERSIHIPSGYKVIVNKGTKLDLINSSLIMSYSPLHLIGSKENPIIISSSDFSGEGIFVLKAEQSSLFEYVQFNNLSNPKKNEWELSGAITLYESDVLINHCIFFNNQRGDDYLNIIRSEFNIVETQFNSILSDAFDSDFSQGSIVNSLFQNIGNDAIDVSGTQMTMKNIAVNNASDKAISAGENSHIEANNLKIKNSKISICSKDKSEVIISDIELENNEIGFAAFQKKSEFGPGSIVAQKVKIKNILTPYLIEAESYCKINDIIKKSNIRYVKDILYPKKSK